MISKEGSFDYDVVLSFAGEDRKYAEDLAGLLKNAEVKVFYDTFEEVDLWGKDLYEHLADVYASRARYCVMFISEYYAKKPWPKHERKNAQARSFREVEEYILPVRLDDTQIPGIPETIGYLDLRKISVEDLAAKVLLKLGKAASGGVPKDSDWSVPRIPMPNIKKNFSQRDKDVFLKETFDHIKSYFEHGLQALGQQEVRVKTEFTEVTNLKFLAKVYMDGSLKSQCKIWQGGFVSSSNQICYSEGSDVSVDQDNSYNDWLTVTDDSRKLLLECSGMWFHGGEAKDRKMSEDDAAEYLWKRFVSRLEE